MSRGESLPVILTALCQTVEAVSEGLLCSILLVDTDGVHMRHGAASSLPEPYVRAIDGLPIGPTAGSCGTAAFRREVVIVSDIAQDPLWTSYRELALPHGLRACWSTPIFSNSGAVLGTFAMYYRTSRLPTAAERDLVERSVYLASIAIQRQRASDAERGGAERLKGVIDSALDAVITMDASGVITGWNPQAEMVFGWPAGEVLGRPLSETIVPPHHREAHVQGLQRFLTSGQGPIIDRRVEMTALHRDGYEF